MMLPVEPFIRTYEPRERASAGVAVATFAPVLLWFVYVTFFLNGIPMAGLMLGIAVSATASAPTIVCWYHQRKATATEHEGIYTTIEYRYTTAMDRMEKAHQETRTLLADLREDHKQLLASLQCLAAKYDWDAYGEGLAAGIAETEPSAQPTPIRRNGIRPVD